MRAKRLSAGRYEYHGFIIRLLDKSYTDGQTIWHIIDNETIVDSASTLRAAKALIDGWAERSK